MEGSIILAYQENDSRCTAYVLLRFLDTLGVIKIKSSFGSNYIEDGSVKIYMKQKLYKKPYSYANCLHVRL